MVVLQHCFTQKINTSQNIFPSREKLFVSVAMIRPQKIYVKSHSFQTSALFDFAYSSQWETKKKKITFFLFCFATTDSSSVPSPIRIKFARDRDGEGGGEWGVFNGYRVLVWQDEKLLEIGCKTMGIHIMLLNHRNINTVYLRYAYFISQLKIF